MEIDCMEMSVIDVAKCLLQELENMESDTLEEAFVFAFSNVFGDSLLLSAVDLIQRNRITKLTSPNGKVLFEFQVIGRNEKLLTIFEKSNYCFCRKFQTKVMKEKAQLTCKHILAVRISTALKRFKQRNITDKQMANVLIEVMSFDENINVT